MPHLPLIDTLKLLAALQTESTIAILSNTQKEMVDHNDFDKQTKLTNQILKQAQTETPDFKVLLPKQFFDAFDIRNNLAFRKNQKRECFIDWYQLNLQYPIYQMVTSHISDCPHFSPAQTSALIHLMASLTHLSHLRDLGIAIYANAEMTSPDVQKLKKTASSYLARERLYLGLADKNLRTLMDEAKGSPIASVGQVDEILRRTKSGFAKSVLADTPFPNWYKVFNTELFSLHRALQTTICTLTEYNIGITSQNSYSRALDQDVEHYLPMIGALPLFRGIPETTLRMLLNGAHLLHLGKNDLFLRQGESINKHYIVLNGWVKSYKTNADGQESILQILGKKECLLDTGLEGISLSGLSAKTISEAQILTIAISVMRDHLSRNRELTQNLLSATQTRLHKLVGQYEQVTLSTAMQRVGWFFVNLHLETGLEGKPLELPFDKSLIAAYLNIKPETFSRTLKEFRKKGFKINRHQIELPNPYALCDYCDPEMATRCCRAETVNCAPIQAARKAQ